jgi:hypothetical protein
VVKVSHGKELRGERREREERREEALRGVAYRVVLTYVLLISKS